MDINQKEIGKRIARIRKAKGFSQEELANLIGISRPSLTQIELGNRNISVIELKSISNNLTISIDALLGNDFNQFEYADNEKIERAKNEIRISVPQLNKEKFQNILLYLLEKCAGKPNIGETLLYKLLYFSDFNYYELYEEHLTGAEYRKLTYGPVPQNINSIINELIVSDKIKRVKTQFHQYRQTRYIPLAKPDLTKMKASEKEVIDQVVHQYSNWSAAAISDYSHKDMPWLASKDGAVIDYELVFYREHPYSVRNYEEDFENTSSE